MKNKRRVGVKDRWEEGRDRAVSLKIREINSYLIVQVQDCEILGTEMENKDFLIIDITCLRNYLYIQVNVPTKICTFKAEILEIGLK